MPAPDEPLDSQWAPKELSKEHSGHEEPNGDSKDVPTWGHWLVFVLQLLAFVAAGLGAYRHMVFLIVGLPVLVLNRKSVV